MKPVYVDIFELVVTVEQDGVRGWVHRAYAKVTGQNYIRQIPPEDAAKKYHASCLLGRLNQTDLMKVRRRYSRDMTDSISREIYFLEGQEQEAKRLVKEDLEATLTRMSEQMSATQRQWNDFKIGQNL